MSLVSHWPIRLARTIVVAALFSLPIALLSAQGSYGMKQGAAPAMTGASPAMASSTAASGGAAASPAPLQGMIVSVEGSTLVLSEAGGLSARVVVGPDTLVLRRDPAALASIKSGDALGVAATREADGSLKATAINIFAPEVWQKARKGQFPMASGQVMTNAQVYRSVESVGGRTIYLKYDMLDAAIDVPDGADIKRMVLIGQSDLKLGAKVTVRLADGDQARAASISLDAPGA